MDSDDEGDKSSSSTACGLESERQSDSTVEGKLSQGNSSETLGYSSDSEGFDLSKHDSSSLTLSETSDDICDEENGGDKSSGITSHDESSTGGSEDELVQKLESASASREETREREAVGNILASRCGCVKECLLSLTGHTLIATRRKVFSLTRNEKRQWIFEKVVDNSKMVNGKLETTFVVGGLIVCRTAFQLMYQIPPKAISRAIKSVLDGDVMVEHGNKGQKKPTEKLENAKVWMTQYFKLIGDKMPTTGQIHLPSWDNRMFMNGTEKTC